jgi:hypothetical protein
MADDEVINILSSWGLECLVPNFKGRTCFLGLFHPAGVKVFGSSNKSMFRTSVSSSTCRYNEHSITICTLPSFTFVEI